ncbi:uncharacterized protein DUF4234 [Kribbella orskensis]|uniref:Uncharacterized protein DUF4234 n=1 Tax=Kribbella orskensis TaxID=2512216 RepID=A0ABY2BAR8_9ACTN|nr:MULTISPECIES: DUF4234 domain-containing protein [Kribbella]TCN33462.1 uncharacterized protein DUF4234 [Kribbella sp. VKM Ac-2500]TCO13608.1 uncharacterized protein DUF4234 [Kribbella orskensis]
MSHSTTPNFSLPGEDRPEMPLLEASANAQAPAAAPTAAQQTEVPQPAQYGNWQAPVPQPIAHGTQRPLPAHTAPAYQPLPMHQQQAIGQIRSTGLAMFLFVITLGIYGLVWFYQVHDEMKRHTGQGLGGGLGLLTAFFLGIVSPFIVSAEVGQLYQQRGLQRPVSGTTGLWYVLGIFILVGPIVWFVKTNSALNAYWRSLGAS